MTVLVDLTPVIEVPARHACWTWSPAASKAALKDWLTARDEAFRDRIKVVTMAGFSGYRTATAETLDKARTVMDPFHVMHLAAEQLDPVSQRVE